MNYEESVRKRRLENRQLLNSLGILNLRQELATSANSVKPRFAENSIRKASKVLRQKATSSILSPSRRSNRLLGKEAPKYADIEEIEAALPQIRKAITKHSGTPNSPREKIKRENFFGAVPDVSVGTEYSTRMEASHAGVHRPPVAGIHGNPALGCYSIALSGGYEDDVDLGDSFIYTGEGGRDLKGTKVNPKNLRTAAQSKDQVLARGNLALSKNVENNIPVRVLRGYKLNSQYAPVEGYRYDGLYKVVEYYLATGKSGFSVYKFRFERLADQEPAPWSNDFQLEENENSNNAENLSEKESVSNNAVELCEVTPFSDKGNTSDTRMELDDDKECDKKNERELPEGTSLYNKENVLNDKVIKDDISSLEDVDVNDIK